ncbi:FecR family protein [Chryseobacterium sp. UNC8MFCol]|uniref:FecR family protein n=1 Tax=Chryseobacterium sp. UNC8MFCol TaxID=1340435 RepID=UPI00069017B2|nr:FecR family protein [Chryseobacterium sp. UNC8MFCol]
MNRRKHSQPTAIDEAKELWDSLTNDSDADIEPPTVQEAKEFHQKLYARIEAHEAQKRRRKTFRYSSMLIAASLVIIFSIIAYRTLLLPDVYRAYHDDLKVTLKDGSTAILAKGAILAVEKSFPAATRDVFLTGDAVFNVTKSKNHPFIVHAGLYETKVLGTVFKISQHKKTFNVDLYEGKVQVIKTEKPAETFILHPKETFSNQGSKDVATIVDTKSTGQSQTNNSATVSLTDLELSNAIKILENTYGIKIRFPPAVANSKISATKEKATAADLIRLISLKLNLKTTKINDKTFQLEE